MTDNENENLPPTLHAQLRTLYTPTTPFPQSLDAEILAAIKPQKKRRLILPLALAASIAIAAATLWTLQKQNTPTSNHQLAYTPTGDIRDAFYLQRQLKAKAKLPTTWDQNHDGLINNHDVQSLAQAAVRLAPKEGATQ